MKKIFKVIFVLSFMGLFASCGSSYNGDNAALGGSTEKGDVVVENNVVIETERKMVYTVNYSITNDDMVNIKNSITNKVNEIKGYIQTSNEYTTNARIVYKVPTEKLDLFLDYVDSFDGVGSKSVSSEDITTAYSYVQARLEVLTATRASYVKLLEGATTQNNILQYQKMIDDIDVELLRINNEKKLYDNKLDYSQVTIQFYSNPKVEKDNKFFENYGKFLLGFIEGFGGFVLYSLPFAVVFGGIFASIFVPIKVRKNKKNKQQ